jgi:hypothetical protein
VAKRSGLDPGHRVVKKRKTIVNTGERGLLGRGLNAVAGIEVIDIAMKGVNEKNGIAVIEVNVLIALIAATEIEIGIGTGETETEITIVVEVMIVVIVGTVGTVIVIGIGTDIAIVEAARDLMTNTTTNSAKR